MAAVGTKLGGSRISAKVGFNDFDKVADRLGDAAGRIMEDTAERIVERAQKEVHSSRNRFSPTYDYTDNLHDGISTGAVGQHRGAAGSRVYGEHAMIVASSVEGGSDREYAAFEEYGTESGWHPRAGHPFLGPAVESQRDYFFRRLGRLEQELSQTESAIRQRTSASFRGVRKPPGSPSQSARTRARR